MNADDSTGTNGTTKTSRVFQEFVQRRGAVGASIVVTLLSVLFSVLITAIAHAIWSTSGSWTPQEIITPIAVPLIVAPVASFFAFRLLERVMASEARNAQLLAKLRAALDDVERLSGLLPICAHCKSIRDEQDHWQTIENYVTENSEASFSHSLCPECTTELYPELENAG